MTKRAPFIDLDVERLRMHLVRTRLSGNVGTAPQSTLENSAKLVAGEIRYTFGLSDWRTATVDEACDAVAVVCGGDPRLAADPGGNGWIDPEATLRAIAVHRDALSGVLDHGDARVLLATGHPTGLLPHYQAIGRALQAAGCQLLAPLDDVEVRRHEVTGYRRALRFLDGVACVHDGGRLLHSHRSIYMERMLDELGGGPGAVDLVLGDHGMAGAAIERGLPTLSIADVNDPALHLAQMRGRTLAVMPIDDNLAPSTFGPVTSAMISGSGAILR